LDEHARSLSGTLWKHQSNSVLMVALPVSIFGDLDCSASSGDATMPNVNPPIRALLAAVLLMDLRGRAVAANPPEAGVWDHRFASPGVDEWVGAMAFDQKEMYIGGAFQAVGPVIAGSLAHYDGKKWLAVPGEPQLEWPLLNVMALEVFENTLYVGGYFTNAGGLSAGGIAALKNKQWSVPGVTNGSVLALRKDGRSLLVGGRFTPPGFTNPVALARFDGRKWTVLNSELTPCEDGACVSGVEQVEVIGPQIFSSVSVSITDWWYPAYLLAQYDDVSGWAGIEKPTDDELAWFQLSQFNNQLVFGGSFANETNASLRNIARWDGSEWLPMGAGLPGEVYALAANDSFLYAAHLVERSAEFRWGVSRWNGVQWDRVGTSDFVWDDPLRLFLSPDGTLYLSRIMNGRATVAAPGLARWNGTQWESLFKGKNFQGAGGGIRTIRAFALHQGEVFMGGIFLSAGDQVTQGIARWDGEAWHDVDGGIYGNPAHRVEALHSVSNLLWAGGFFTNIGGVFCSNVAAWDGTNWQVAGKGFDERVMTLADWRGSIYAGGRFTAAEDVPVNRIAQWNGSAWLPLGAGCDDTVNALVTWRDRLIAGGRFTMAGDQALPALAMWDGTDWKSVGGGVGGAEQVTVSRVAVANDSLYVAGNFRTAGESAVTNIARWDGTNWQSVGGGFDGVIGALATHGSDIFLAGRRTNVLGESIEGGVYRLNADRWDLLPNGPSHSGGPQFARVQALLPCDGELFAGGRFSWAGGRPSASVARWIERPWSRLSIANGNQSVQVTVDATPGVSTRLETSADLLHWIDLSLDEDLRTTEHPKTAAPQFFRAIIRR
jgi:trimeric autotransporter adhesin